MFELPNAKRVKRSQLFSSAPSSEDEQDNTQAPKHSTSQDSGLKAKRKRTTNDISKTLSDDDVDMVDTDPSQPVDYGFEYEYVDRVQLPVPTAASSDVQRAPNVDATENPAENLPVVEQDQQEQSFEFNLFARKSKLKVNPQAHGPSSDTSTSKPTTAISHTPPPPLQEPYDSQTKSQPKPTPQKITILTTTPSPPPTLDPSTHGTNARYTILHPRPSSHYFTSSTPKPIQERQQIQFAAAAVTPTALSQLSRTSWPGTHLPWRVTYVPRSRLVVRTDTGLNISMDTKSTDASVNIATDTKSTNMGVNGSRVGRPRPSKKRRVQLRKRVALRQTLQAQTRKAEEVEREKRTRRNREKKVKKKMKEKAKKALAGTGLGAGMEEEQ